LSPVPASFPVRTIDRSPRLWYKGESEDGTVPPPTTGDDEMTTELAAIARRAAAALRAGEYDADTAVPRGEGNEYDALREAYPDETDTIDECETDEDAAAELEALAAQIEAE